MPEDSQYGRNMQHVLTELMKFVVVAGISLSVLKMESWGGLIWGTVAWRVRCERRQSWVNISRFKQGRPTKFWGPLHNNRFRGPPTVSIKLNCGCLSSLLPSSPSLSLLSPVPHQSLICDGHWDMSLLPPNKKVPEFEPMCIIMRDSARTFLQYQEFHAIPANVGGTRWRSWLRNCARSRKVADSIPDGVLGFFFIDIILPTALWPWGWLSL